MRDQRDLNNRRQSRERRETRLQALLNEFRGLLNYLLFLRRPLTIHTLTCHYIQYTAIYIPIFFLFRVLQIEYNAHEF